ncbi:MAG TPA: RDD family protein [Candidatus Limnocylindria bacterium]|nr:RDD family protein [Candidatus Limnocylindria bacterium]
MAVTTNKAGFWIRTFAYLIDAIGIGVVSGVLGSIGGGGATGTTANGLSFLIGIAYFCYFWSAQGGGQTLGMRALNLRVMRTDGSALTITQALIRYVGLVVSFICFAIGVIWVAFDADKQGWHDKIAGTYVIRT